jgi:myo-inositol 2-dehydrogenase / D-chiro-inositol 1-dehydrogenase
VTVRIGLIGAGAIGYEHARRLTGVVNGAAVTAVTDIDTARAERVATAAGARITGTGGELVAASDVDAVLVASWGPTHAEHVLAAIAAGKPVFVEKPLATTAADCLRIVEAEAAYGSRLVQVGFMRRFDTGYRELKQLFDAGSLGAPLMVHCVHRNATAGESYTSDMAARDTAVHEIDVLRWLLADEIVSAQVITPRRTGHRYGHLQDPQFMLFETAGGVRIDLEVFVNCQYGYEIGCEVVGETGTARLPEPARVTVRSAGVRRAAVPQGWEERFAAAFNLEFQEWVDAVAAGRLTGPSSWDGYAATVVTDATVESLRSGRVVAVHLKDQPALLEP